ncbi:hypothetical protein BO94DRAFT_541727 [Aspergillus sclerotioniger CBS 115572]|uniref:Uncharacterized protein n=1 Tax=Aspergillus sclerotioniger CBS 115572 TaxID=1450535 RepID=A0A317XD16_9EURO|nr:hypothetical protein BO94DRAFT_541727 [Aspergillus sclerotioniger CBS 115572]PWY95602.1 hypothetical protein BO94DRAFT_541727 [Aspergillus sclerotioniger CBS 115572]
MREFPTEAGEDSSRWYGVSSSRDAYSKPIVEGDRWPMIRLITRERLTQSKTGWRGTEDDDRYVRSRKAHGVQAEAWQDKKRIRPSASRSGGAGQDLNSQDEDMALNFRSCITESVMITHNSCKLFLGLAYFRTGAAHMAEQKAVTWNCFSGS